MKNSIRFWHWIYRSAPKSLQGRIIKGVPPLVKQVRLEIPEEHVLVFDNARESTIFPKMFWQQTDWEETLPLQLFYAAAKTANVIFDVGAYLGLYSLFASRANPQAKIFAFEPFPESLKLLSHYTALNRCANVQAHQIALGDVDESSCLFVPDRSNSRLPNINSLKNRFTEGESFSNRGSYQLPVSVRSIDSFVESEKIRELDLIKIDTEETELQVFLGGRVYLSHSVQT